MEETKLFTIDSKLGLKGKRKGPLLEEAILLQLPVRDNESEAERVSLAEDVAYLTGALKFRYVLQNNLYENKISDQKELINIISQNQGLDYNSETNELYSLLG